MKIELHKFCNCANFLLHTFLNDVSQTRYYSAKMNIKGEAGRRLQAARLAKGMRLEDVAEKIPELSVSRLSNWEHGRNMLGVEHAKRLAPVLGVTAAYLLTLEDHPIDNQENTLLKYYRDSDSRGRNAIFRVAESESKFVDKDDHADKAA